jgi:TonB family protein
MIGHVILSAIVLATSGTQAVGDFDGDGLADAAAIVARAEGNRDVVVTFHGKGQDVLVARVDKDAVLSIVSPAQVVEACRPLVGIIPECTGNVARPTRLGLAFKRMQQEVVGLYIWNGSSFVGILGQDIQQTAGGAPDLRHAVDPIMPPSKAKPTGVAVTPIHHTTLSLDIGSSGRVEACRVVEGSGSSQLDAKACSIAVEQARYAPGEGGSIKPQTRRLRITWPGAQ